MKKIRIFLTIFIFSFVGTAHGQVDPYKAKRGYKGVLFNTPVYNPRSKSYFEMVAFGQKGQASPGRSYGGAMKFAARRKFKGVRGRLAIIRSKETQKFLIRTFKPRGETWIGLRMYCRGRVLFWVDGRRLDRSKDYRNWGRNWFKKGYYVPCNPSSSSKYAGIILGNIKGVVRWIAIEPAHYVRRGFIEYPTGRP